MLYYISKAELDHVLSPDFNTDPIYKEQVFYCGFDLYFLIATDVEHLFVNLLAICTLSGE